MALRADIRILLLLTAIGLFSCRAKREASYAPTASPMDATALLERNAQHRAFGELQSKVSINYANGTERQSFSARVRMKQDSIIWVSIAPVLGIEVVRAVITRDSLLLVDRFNKRFYRAGFGKLNELLDVQVDFAMLQALLTGNHLSIYPTDRYRASTEQTLYHLESDGTAPAAGKRDRSKVPAMPGLRQDVWLDPQGFAVTRTAVHDHRLGNRLEADYSDIRPLGSVLFPQKMAFRITGKENALVDIQWAKPEPASGLEYPFSIPDKYEPYR